MVNKATQGSQSNNAVANDPTQDDAIQRRVNRNQGYDSQKILQESIQAAQTLPPHIQQQVMPMLTQAHSQLQGQA
jgi:hypothetical protein